MNNEESGLHFEEITDAVLRDGEKAIVDKIGRKHIDYCTVAVLKSRRPDMNIEYNENQSTITADGVEVLVHFEVEGLKEALEENHPDMDMIALMVDGLENTIKLAKDYSE